MNMERKETYKRLAEDFKVTALIPLPELSSELRNVPDAAVSLDVFGEYAKACFKPFFMLTATLRLIRLRLDLTCSQMARAIGITPNEYRAYEMSFAGNSLISLLDISWDENVPTVELEVQMRTRERRMQRLYEVLLRIFVFLRWPEPEKQANAWLEARLYMFSLIEVSRRQPEKRQALITHLKTLIPYAEEVFNFSMGH